MATCSKVFLRQKPISKGRISLYLDFWPAIRNPHTMKLTRREFLGFYIYADPKNHAQREYNDDLLEKAELIRCRRQESVINREFGFVDRHQQQEDFLAYYKEMCCGKDDKWAVVYGHFSKFVNGKCTFGEVTIDLCKRFGEYLLTANSLRHPKRKISRNSAAGYYSTFRGLLKIAYRDKLILENINDFLERIETDEVRKEFLTQDELIQLAATPCKIDVLRRASLFSCTTGLRISDILNLTWEDIQIAPDMGLCMRIRTQKTQTEAILPISYEALELCGERSTGKVFKGLRRSMINHPLKVWLKEAGITKPITFHGFRHTYATLQIAAGTDIYTVSKMLTHKNVTTTQIYADLVSQKKRDTVGKIRLK
jgi:integrase